MCGVGVGGIQTQSSQSGMVEGEAAMMRARVVFEMQDKARQGKTRQDKAKQRKGIVKLITTGCTGKREGLMQGPGRDDWRGRQSRVD
jgi:hypothetical protein